MRPELPPHLQDAFARVMSEPPEPSDAIVWLQGDRFDRGPKVLELYRQGLAPLVVVTGNDAFVGRAVRPGRDDARLGEIRGWLEAHGVPSSAVLILGQAHHTGEQAALVIAAAQERDWHAVTIVASPYHQLRACLTFRKRANEAGWAGRILNQPISQGWDSIPSDRDATNAELLQEELGKIETYGLL